MRNSGVIAAAQVVWQSVALFVVYRIAAQAAGISMLGAWSTGVAVAGLITVADIGLTDLMVREVARATGKQDWSRIKGLCRTALLIVPLAVGLFALLALQPIAYLLRVLTPTLIDTTAVALAGGAVALVWLTILATGAAGVLEAFGRYDLKAVSAVVGGAVSIGVAWVVAQTMPPLTVVMALLAAAAVNLVLLLLACYVVLRRLPGAAAALPRQARVDMFRMGVQARLGALTNLGFDPLVRFMILRFGGAESSGFYELAYRLVIQLRSVLVASTQVMVPRLTRERAQGNDDGTAIWQLTLTSMRLAAAALWAILMVLPLLSAAMLGRVEMQVLSYGAILTIAWLINFVAVPAYYGNFVEGALRLNRQSHVLMLAAAAVLGIPSGMLFGGLGVVIATSVAICCGSVFILVSRGRELAAKPVTFSGADYAVTAIGLLAVACCYGLALVDAPVRLQVYFSLATTAAYLAASARTVTRLVGEHLRRISG